MSTSTAASTVESTGRGRPRCNRRARALPHHVHDRFGREYQWGTCKEPQRGAQSAHFVAHTRSAASVAIRMRLTASSWRHRAARCKPPQHTVRGFRSRRRPEELPFAPNLGCTAQPRVHGSTFNFNPSSWARVVPIPRFGLTGSPDDGCNWRAHRGVVLHYSFVCLKMILTREFESLRGWYWRATTHNMTI